MRLDKQKQDAILKAAAAAEERGWRVSQEAGTKAVETLKSKGMTINQPSEKFMNELRTVSQSMIDEWVKKAGPDGAAIVKAMQSK
jgi:TRAP-type C4-dicarboxylate transport system substrate-binding protein